MGGPSDGRLTPLLRWLGLTMVVILVLQMVALLVEIVADFGLLLH